MTFREECLGCGHAPHSAGECSRLTLFVKSRCACDVARPICTCSGDEYVPSMGLSPHRSNCPADRLVVTA